MTVVVDALVTDAHSRAAVAGLRDLGRAGLTVGALAPSRSAAGLRSRYARVSSVGPPSTEPARFMRRVGTLARRHGPCVVFPSQEETLDPFIAHMGDLPGEAIVPYPGPEPLRLLRDKASVSELVRSAGLAAVDRVAEGSAGDLMNALPATPCVVKSPGLSASLPVARVAREPEQLRATLARLPADEPVIVQEHAGGPLIGLALVIDRDGSVVARFQQSADLLWPLDAGGSRRATSVAPDPSLVAAGRRLLVDAGYWGLAQLQFLRSRRGLAVIDVNPRFYGSMALATAAGVNLPAAWHGVAVGEPPPGPSTYRVGVSYRWLEGELFAAVKGDRRELFARRPRPGVGAMWATDDPLAGAVLAADAAWTPLAARFRRRWPR